MTQERPPIPPPSRPGRSEPWRVERMVQRVPAHLGETTREVVSPWLMIAGVAVLLVVACAVIFMLLGGTSRLGLGVAVTPTSTQTPTSMPETTSMPITLPPATTAVPGPTAVIVKYKVKAGDNLTAIAARYKVTIQAIMAANGMKTDTIRIGDELIIPLPTPTPVPGSQLSPPPGTTPTAISFQSSPPPSATSAGTPGVIRHTVQKGDTLITIAATYGSTVDGIRAANQLPNDFLSVGQVLLVPVGAWTPTATATVVAITTATPTSEFAYAAPSLLSPSNDKQFRGSQDVPQLMWTAPAALKPNEFYIVHVEYTLNGKKQVLASLTVRQGTSVKLSPAPYYPGPSTSGAQFSWYVVIVSESPANAPSQTQTLAQSPASVTRTFVWY
jgi:LysM repeat protein